MVLIGEQRCPRFLLQLRFIKRRPHFRRKTAHGNTGNSVNKCRNNGGYRKVIDKMTKQNKWEKSFFCTSLFSVSLEMNQVNKHY